MFQVFDFMGIMLKPFTRPFAAAFSCFILISCSDEKNPSLVEARSIEIIVVICNNAPAAFEHLVHQDSIGKTVLDTLGPKMIFPQNGFSYLDETNTVQIWEPTPLTSDTLRITCTRKYLELATRNPYTAMEETFLVQPGDTVVFDYNNDIPVARIANRPEADVALNYNRFRLKRLFGNKYTSHHMILMHIGLLDDFSNFEKRTLDYYYQALEDGARELELLDSLYKARVLTNVQYVYRKRALEMQLERNKEYNVVREHLQKFKGLDDPEIPSGIAPFNLAETDSLMAFSFFRDYLDRVTRYGLDFIVEDNGNSGGAYLDSRRRFDSILTDERLNQTARNFLLFKVYEGIGQNFGSDAKKSYLEKLKANTTDSLQLSRFILQNGLDFSRSDKLVLTNMDQETTYYDQVLKNNRGHWLYVDFWASWCQPCRIMAPHAVQLKNELQDKNVRFIYLSLNDKKRQWKAAIEKDGTGDALHYFIENGRVSKVIDELAIEGIPRYLIYNPEGQLVSGNAKWPGMGAKEELLALMGSEN